MISFVFCPLGEGFLKSIFYHIKFAANNRHQSFGGYGLIKLERAKHVPVIGDRQRRHTIGFGLLDQAFNTGCPV